MKDAETHDVICIARFKYTIALQIISAWGMRYGTAFCTVIPTFATRCS